MGTLYIQSETLTNIADAIREKAGTSTAMSPSQMVSAIGEISSGGDLVDFIENGPSETFENSEVSKIRDYAFYSCSSLQSVNLPMVSYIGSNAFVYCTLLQSINLPMASYIGSYAFVRCYNLLSLYLGSTSVCSLYTYNAFNMTPIASYTTSTGGVYGSIYVPASLLTSYKTATNWTIFSSRFVGV